MFWIDACVMAANPDAVSDAPLFGEPAAAVVVVRSLKRTRLLGCCCVTRYRETFIISW